MLPDPLCPNIAGGVRALITRRPVPSNPDPPFQHVCMNWQRPTRLRHAHQHCAVQWLAPCRRVPQPTTPHMCMHAPCSCCKAASWACITPPYPWTVFGRCNGNTHHSGSPVCCTKALPPVPAPAPLAVPARTALQACRDSRLWGAAYAARACCASGATAVMPALAAADA